MNQDQEPTDLEEMLDQIEETAHGQDSISFGLILDVVGRRSFGPLLLIAGLIILAPIIGDIPGVPTLVGVFVFLIAGQLLLRQKHLWVPEWLLKRSVDQSKLSKALKWMRSPAKYVDKFLSSRLTFLTGSKGVYSISIFCILIALALPMMELVPFSANGGGLALTLFGLAIIAQDGLMALLAFIFTLTTLILSLFGLM